VVVARRGIPDPTRRYGIRNAYLLLRDRPAVSGDDVASWRAAGNGLMPVLTPRGRARLEALIATAREKARRSGRQERLLVVLNGQVLAAPVIGPQTDPSDLASRPLRLASSSLLGPYGSRDLVARQLVPGSSGVILEQLGARAVGSPVRRGGVRAGAIPSYIRRVIDYDRRIVAAAPPSFRPTAAAKLVDPASVRRMVRLTLGPGRIALWTGLRRDGGERTFLVGTGAPRNLVASVGDGCELAPDHPALVSCAALAIPSGHNIALFFGRVAPDVGAVELQGSGGGAVSGRLAIANGWFMLRARIPRRGGQLVARDGSARVVGRAGLSAYEGGLIAFG
jgi:hypothetical protein